MRTLVILLALLPVAPVASAGPPVPSAALALNLPPPLDQPGDLVHGALFPVRSLAFLLACLVVPAVWDT